MKKILLISGALLVLAGIAYQLFIRSSGPTTDPDFVMLFDGSSLDGWRKIGGEAQFRIQDGAIVGEKGPGENTFLRTERDDFGDFELRLEMRWDEPGNSGIMFRAQQRQNNGRAFGYQYELDHSERAWSAGIYDEARRGWLFNLENDQTAREAVKLDDWNTVRIEAIGASIKTWINDVPVAELVDGQDFSGYIALQVHSGSTGVMRWRNIKIREITPGYGPGPSLADSAQWKLKGVEDWQIEDGIYSGQFVPEQMASLTTRRRFADFVLNLTLPVCETDSIVSIRHQSEPGGISKSALIRLNNDTASVTLETRDGQSPLGEVKLDQQATRTLQIVALDDALTVTADGQDIARLLNSGLPDRGQLQIRPAPCSERFEIRNLDWTDLSRNTDEILFYQTLDNKPAPVLSPEQALASFTLAEGFEIELVAGEPDVEDPVAMAWDEDGRLYVVEMRGFMPDAYGEGQDQPVGRVVRLTDTNGDGRMDKSEVFLDHLVMPRAVAVVNEGILIAEPPNLWLCELPNKEALCSNKHKVGDYGLSDGDTSIEHLENALMLGLDNRLYNSKSSRSLNLQNGAMTEREEIFRGQWGITQDNWGRLLYNNNSNFITADYFPGYYLRAEHALTKQAGLQEVLSDPEEVFSIRVNPGVNRAYLDGTLRKDGRLQNATAVSGLVAYRGGQFPPEFHSDVFVPEPGANVVAQFRLSEAGMGLSAEHLTYPDTKWDQREFLASTDERFRPVDAKLGPDGALYIIDMYRGIIQEQHFLTDELREQIFLRELDRPLGRGRIWRIRHKAGAVKQPAPALSTYSSAELVDALGSDNGWVRDTAQRLLLARDDVPLTALQASVTGSNSLAATHALWVLVGRNELDEKTLSSALAHRDFRVQIQALRAGESGLEERQLQALASRDELPEALQVQLAFSLAARASGTESQEVLLNLLAANFDSVYLQQAIARAVRGQELEFLPLALTHPVLAKESDAGASLLGRLAGQAYLTQRGSVSDTGAAPQSLIRVLDLMATEQGADEWRQLAMLDGLSRITLAPGFVTAVMTEAPAIFADPNIDGDSPLWGARLKARRAFTWPGDELAAGIIPLSPQELALMQQGEAFYGSCANCHGSLGEGIAGLAPALANSPWITGPPEWLGRIILQGMIGPVEINNETWDGVMPAHGQQAGLDNATLAGLMTYLRRAWGHTESPVDEKLAADIRQMSDHRSKPWTVEELKHVKFDRGYGRFIGKYKVSFVTFTVSEIDGELNLSVPMYGGGPLVEITPTLFEVVENGESVQIEFIVEEDSTVKQLILTRGGQKIPIKRIEE
jgi:glucose/arabinose dehydrogenase/mono/diheme cytochrome c family protein